jgi:ADP-ribose pyrophosphatase YjhB (NUDIX family)
MPNLESQKYRASIAGIFIKDNNEILLVQNNSFGVDEWDFPKGGMNLGEDEEDTLKREIQEELGDKIKYSIIRASSCNIIYTWSKEKQAREGMRGQARISYWLKYIEGEIEIDTSEIRKFKWVPVTELEEVLKKSNWPLEIVEMLLFDLKNVITHPN